MIQNVPTAEDFREQGLNFLNLAWDLIFELLNSQFEQKIIMNIDQVVTQAYWLAAQKPLSIAYALAQQGAELILKSIIAEESPFLLIVDFPTRLNKSTPTVYSDFKTADAQSLIAMRNTISSGRIPEQFINQYKKFRTQRNILFHTVDNTLVFYIHNIVEYILDIANLVIKNNWFNSRKDYIAKTPNAAMAAGYDFTMNDILRDFGLMIEILPPESLKNYFDFDKKQRRYLCPECYNECEHDYIVEEYIDNMKTALLSPNEPLSTNVHCYVCGSDCKIERRDCKSYQCKGNVIDATLCGKNFCLTCSMDMDEG